VPRVLILSWEYPPIVEGGLARHVRKLAEGLVWAGAEVHVLARGGGRLAAIEDRHGVTVHPSASRSSPRTTSTPSCAGSTP
jgi:glycogen synthase